VEPEEGESLSENDMEDEEYKSKMKEIEDGKF
jgi:hypothetical protein